MRKGPMQLENASVVGDVVKRLEKLFLSPA
jgi:hypothetical protein